MFDSDVNTKGDFMENLAHDLKSPVFSQINALKLLLNDKNCHLEDNQLEILNCVLASNIYMKNMILNMLTGFKQRKEGMLPDYTSVNIYEAIYSTIESIKHLFVQKDQKIHYAFECKSPYCECDEIKIKRVISNILTNASKYSPDSSMISVKVYNENALLVFEAVNDGHIDCENIDDVFKIYKTGRHTKSYSSSGLGLFISKRIIEEHGGKISVNNIAGNKVVFSFKIPIVNTNL